MSETTVQRNHRDSPFWYFLFFLVSWYDTDYQIPSTEYFAMAFLFFFSPCIGLEDLFEDGAA